jgi:hypothetical protein
MAQTTSNILMIRPVAFNYNAQTAENNYYQTAADASQADSIQSLALVEFNTFVATLEEAGVDVLVVDDTPEPPTPDSIFPNNWVSFHEDGSIFLYPMFAPNRRQERRMDVLDQLRLADYRITQIVDMTDSEEEGRYLEGTGSLVLDRENRIAYACISVRTHADLLAQWAAQTGYRTVTFDAMQNVNGELLPIYHTNVMMSVGTEIAIVCADSVKDAVQREELLSTLKKTGKHIVLISEEQKHEYAGNMLEVKNKDGQPLMVMSSQAYHSLSKQQVAEIEAFCSIVHSDIRTIETYGGGSARCMMAEIFLPSKEPGENGRGTRVLTHRF